MERPKKEEFDAYPRIMTICPGALLFVLFTNPAIMGLSLLIYRMRLLV